MNFGTNKGTNAKITATRADTPARRRSTHVSLTWRFDLPITRGLWNVSG